MSGFKNFEKSTFIYEPDRMKNEMFSVRGQSVQFLSFCIFNFQLAQIAPQFLVLKVPPNLSNNCLLLSKDYKLRNIVGAHAFDSVLDTSAPWTGK